MEEIHETLANLSLRSRKHGIIDNDADLEENLKRLRPSTTTVTGARRRAPNFRENRNLKKQQAIDQFFSDSDDADDEEEPEYEVGHPSKSSKVKARGKKKHTRKNVAQGKKDRLKKQLKKVLPNKKKSKQDDEYEPSDISEEDEVNF